MHLVNCELLETIDTELPSGYPFLSVDRDYIEAFPVLMKRIELVQDCISTFLTYENSKSIGLKH